jgi:imidazole glycerol-phosphate synthase subunit HisH
VNVAVIDYQAGNLTSVLKALSEVGAFPFLTNRVEDVVEADGIVIPGVGHFAATGAIDESVRTTVVSETREGKPLLGICLGMQFLFEASDEAPGVRGLGLLQGTCSVLPPTFKVPHVGWNSLVRTRPSRILEKIADGSQVYFTHSYAAPITDDTAATTDHGRAFASVVERGNVFGVQFHPEKSGDVGLTLLRTFLGSC